MKRIVIVFAVILLFLGWTLSLRQFTAGQFDGSPLPTLEFLGEGEAPYNEPGWNFIVKRIKPYRLVFVQGPIYTAGADERVWRSMGTNGAPPAVYHVDTEIGFVDQDCVIRYVAIDDDIDDRINHFLLDGEIIHSLPQGMTAKGEFALPRAGNLVYQANDSIGMYLDVCSTFITPAPTDTLEPTSTGTITATTISTATITPISTGTMTMTPIISGTVTPNATGTAVSLTPTSTVMTPPPLITVTLQPPLTPPPSMTPTITPTRRPTRIPYQACLRVNFEVSGHEARAGRYDVVEVSGKLLFSWEAKDGWQDSGWVYRIDTTYNEVYVDVYFVPADGGPTIKMNMLNPAPGTSHGWVAQGKCHALEVGWP